MEQWIVAVLRWRMLTPEQRRDIRRRRLPAKVARSMAFEGEAVDLCARQRELPDASTPSVRRNCFIEPVVAIAPQMPQKRVVANDALR
ncbi:MAG: hypothetical protein J0L57_05390 [Burkholderiales bacterium]|nr:hypothetical protein [Burkholderiales bacterium]